MRGVTVNLIEIILIILGLAIVAIFIAKFGSSITNKTYNILGLMNSLKGA